MVTGNCRVRVTLTNSIQLTVRFAMSYDEFFNKNGRTLFIDRMAALLDIDDVSRIKVVGIFSGSVVMKVYIT